MVLIKKNIIQTEHSFEKKNFPRIKNCNLSELTYYEKKQKITNEFLLTVQIMFLAVWKFEITESHSTYFSLTLFVSSRFQADGGSIAKWSFIFKIPILFNRSQHVTATWDNVNVMIIFLFRPTRWGGEGVCYIFFCNWVLALCSCLKN